MGNVSTNVYVKFCCVPLHIKKALGIFRELLTTTRATRVAFGNPPSGSKNIPRHATAEAHIDQMLAEEDQCYASTYFLKQCNKQWKDNRKQNISYVLYVAKCFKILCVQKEYRQVHTYRKLNQFWKCMITNKQNKLNR